TRPHRTGRRPPPAGRQRLDEPRPGPRPRPRRTGEPMTSEEAVILVAYVRACCPQQKFDEYTPDAWHDLLGDLTLNDCRAAARTIAQRQPDRKSTRLNSSHEKTSYAVFCLDK